jgi:HK97 family phage portal protein
MAIVSSLGELTAIASPGPSAWMGVTTSGPFYDGYRRTYGEIYKRQPAVRTVVDFFARNIAQLGLQVFERRSDTERVRLVDQPLPQLLQRPNPATSRYRFFESTVQDVGIYANGYWLKVRERDRRITALVRLPALEMRVTGGLVPTKYRWEPVSGSEPREFATTDIVHFRLFDPENPLAGFPPIETLRRSLAESSAASDYRQAFWQNSARVETVITRPADAPDWTPEQKSEFREQWQAFAGKKAGQTPVLEDGMTLKEISFNARDSQYIEARKLTREEVAAEYHVPLPMVGILDHATFSNIREQHKQLYQDCLGPWNTMLEEDIELQLLPEFEDPARVYVEFNIAEKMKGSFEEQADSLNKAVGRPYMTANEARARLNLPRLDDPTADKLAEAAPGQAAPRTAPAAIDKAALTSAVDRFARRQAARLQKDAPEQRQARFDAERWRQELAADLSPLLGSEAAAAAAAVITYETAALLAGNQVAWPTGRLAVVVDSLLEAHRG